MKRLIGAIALLMLLVARFLMWNSSRRVKTSSASKLTAVRVAQNGDFLLYAGLYVAQDTGAFRS